MAFTDAKLKSSAFCLLFSGFAIYYPCGQSAISIPYSILFFNKKYEIEIDKYYTDNPNGLYIIDDEIYPEYISTI